MNRYHSAKLYAAGSVLLPAAAAAAWPSWLWTQLLFLLWTAAAAAVWIRLERKQHRLQLQKAWRRCSRLPSRRWAIIAMTG